MSAEYGADRTLWQGELPTESWMSEEYLKSLWLQFGEQVNVKLIRDKHTGQPVGYAFIEFSTPEASQAALALNGQPIPGTDRAFRLNWASGGGLNDRKGPEYSIFVGDLGPEVTDSMLFAMFQQHYPSCKSAKVVADPMTNVSRGYGFVRFSDELEQQRALQEMQGQYCGYRPIRISIATPKGRDRMPGGLGMPAGLGPGLGLMYSTLHSQPYNQFTDPNNTTVFVGGLSPLATEDELKSYFAPYGDLTYVKIPPGKGCGFVQFAERSAAEVAIRELNGLDIGGSRIRLSWGRSHTAARPTFTTLPPIPANYPVFTTYQPLFPGGLIPANPMMVPVSMPLMMPAPAPISSPGLERGVMEAMPPGPVAINPNGNGRVRSPTETQILQEYMYYASEPQEQQLQPGAQLEGNGN